MESYKKRQKEMKRLERQRDKAAKRVERKLHRATGAGAETTEDAPLEGAEGQSVESPALESRPSE